MNTLIYDSMNIVSRISNKMNCNILDNIENKLEVFVDSLEIRKRRVGVAYYNAFNELICQKKFDFDIDIDLHIECVKQEQDILSLISDINKNELDYLLLQTWLSNVNRFGT